MTEALYERYKEALRRGHVASLRGRPEAALAAYVEAATIAPVPLPAKSWHDVRARAATLGARAELSNDGSQVRILVDLPPA